MNLPKEFAVFENLPKKDLPTYEEIVETKKEKLKTTNRFIDLCAKIYGRPEIFGLWYVWTNGRKAV